MQLSAYRQLHTETDIGLLGKNQKREILSSIETVPRGKKLSKIVQQKVKGIFHNFDIKTLSEKYTIPSGLLIRFAGICSSDIDMEDLCTDYYLLNMLRELPEYILDRVWSLYDIQTTRELMILADIDVNYVLRDAKVGNLENLLNMPAITREVFVSLCEDGYVRDILESRSENNVGLLFDIPGITPEQFRILCRNTYVQRWMEIRNENLETIWNFYNIKTVDEVLALVQNHELCDVLNNSHEANIKSIFSIPGITPEQFALAYQNNGVTYALEYIHGNKLEKILHFYEVKTVEEFIELCANNRMILRVKDAKPGNLDTILNIPNITPEQFTLLCESRFSDALIELSNEKNLQMVLDFYKIKTFDEFKVFIEDADLINILQNAREKNLHRVLSMPYLTAEQFTLLYKNHHFRYVMSYARGANFDNILDLYDIQTHEQLIDLCEDYRIRDILEYATEQNLDKILNISNITVEEFISIYNDMEDIMKNLDEKMFEKIWKFLNIQTIDDLKILSQNEGIKDILGNIDEENLDKILSIPNITPEEFISLCDDDNVGDILKCVRYSKLSTAWDIYQIKTTKQFKNFCQNAHLRYVLRYTDEDILDQMVSFYAIKTPKQLISLCHDGNMRHVLRHGSNNNIKLIISRINITPEQFTSLCGNDAVRDILCSAVSQNLRQACILHNIETPEQYISLCEMTQSTSILKHADRENLLFIWNRYGPKTIDEFNIFYENEDVVDVLANARRSNLEMMIRTLKMTPENLVIACANVDVRDILQHANSQDIGSTMDQLRSKTLPEFIKLCEYRFFMAQNPASFLLQSSELKDIEKTCDNYFDEFIEKNHRKKTPLGEKKKNIEKVNTHQYRLLAGLQLQAPIQIESEDRNLVLYFRDENMCPFEFQIIAYVLNKYISMGYSRVFNKLSIVSRNRSGHDDHGYPHHIHSFGDIEFLDIQKDEFKQQTTLAANIIHLTHGTIIERGAPYMETSYPIIANENLEDPDGGTRVPKSGRYEPMHLTYRTRTVYGGLESHSGKFSSLIPEILRAVSSCEVKMLREATREATRRKKKLFTK